MRRLGLGLLLAVCALAGVLVAVLAAGPVAAAVGTTGTDTTGTTTTSEAWIPLVNVKPYCRGV